MIWGSWAWRRVSWMKEWEASSPVAGVEAVQVDGSAIVLLVLDDVQRCTDGWLKMCGGGRRILVP
eukprot:scaffold4463_cov201-Alexandrium_tamarense.AAC.1